MLILFLIIDSLLILIAIGFIAYSFLKKEKKDPSIKFTPLNEKYGEFVDDLKKHLHEKENRIKLKDKKEIKEIAKKAKRVYILTFKGSPFAEEVETLRHEISAILLVARPGTDEVLVKIDSPGGTVTGYGLAAAQMQRIKDRGIKLTAMVDQVAASGGYMMAVVADSIMAAPFAYIGSVGVVTEFPNFSRLMDKVGIDWRTYTAGNSKRDVGQYGKITPDAEKRHKKKLSDIHILFKNHIGRYRKNVNLNKIATGEVWTAQEAIKLNLVDQLKVSDEVILEQIKLANVYNVYTPEVRSRLDKLMDSLLGKVMVKAKDLIFQVNTEKLL